RRGPGEAGRAGRGARRATPANAMTGRGRVEPAADQQEQHTADLVVRGRPAVDLAVDSASIRPGRRCWRPAAAASPSFAAIVSLCWTTRGRSDESGGV